MEQYDTIIIGAGLAGCCLGKLLLEKNQKVLIFEKRDINNKSKLCGGIITGKSFKILKKIYGNIINDLPFTKLEEFIVKNNKSTLNIKGEILYTIFREDLDNFLLEQFNENGGKIIDKTSYEKIDFQNNILYANGKKYKYKNLVGADGVFSQVRFDLINKQQRKNFALEIYFPKEEKQLQIDFFNNFKGYAWIIPNKKNTILGIGDVSRNTDIKKILINHFTLNDKNSRLKGAFLPSGNDILLQKKNIYFIGDAAGLISPITGEGIYYSLISAFKLSNNIHNNNYIKSMKKETINIKTELFLKNFVYNTKLRNYLFKKYNKSKLITKLISKFIKKIL